MEFPSALEGILAANCFGFMTLQVAREQGLLAVRSHIFPSGVSGELKRVQQKSYAIHRVDLNLAPSECPVSAECVNRQVSCNIL